MTAGELIKLLEKQDPDLPVVLCPPRVSRTPQHVYATVQQPAKVVIA